MPLTIVVEDETERGFINEGQMVGFDQEEEVTLLAMEGYERWEDSMLVKFNEFLGISTVVYEPQIIDPMRKLLANQNKGLKVEQTSVSRCERELKKLECTINYNGQRSARGANRDKGNLLLKFG